MGTGRSRGMGGSKNSGVVGVQQGHGKSLLEGLKVILTNRQTTQEGKLVLNSPGLKCRWDAADIK